MARRGRGYRRQCRNRLGAQVRTVRRAVLDQPDTDFASELVDRLLTSGPAIALDAGQWARIERFLGRTADPAEADALAETLS